MLNLPPELDVIESFDYVYAAIKRDVCLGSITGISKRIGMFDMEGY